MPPPTSEASQTAARAGLQWGGVQGGGGPPQCSLGLLSTCLCRSLSGASPGLRSVPPLRSLLGLLSVAFPGKGMCQAPAGRMMRLRVGEAAGEGDRRRRR